MPNTFELTDETLKRQMTLTSELNDQTEELHSESFNSDRSFRTNRDCGQTPK